VIPPALWGYYRTGSNCDPEENLDNDGAKPGFEREEETHAYLLCLPKRCTIYFFEYLETI
jgi:hypothetical protein